LFWFPVAFFIISGSSMLPVYRVGDVVLGVATYFANYSVGDVVVWYATITHGVVHRVIAITDTYIVTKGDNNPLPDPSIPRNWVKYKVVFWIPREVWITTVCLLLSIYMYVNRRRLVEMLKLEKPGELSVATVILIAVTILDFAFITLTPIYWFSHRAILYTPSVELKKFTVEGFSTAITEYTLNHAELRDVLSCRVLFKNVSYPCSYTRVSGSTVIAGIPKEVYYTAYLYSEGNTASISLALNISFDKGWVAGVYNYTFNWKPLVVEVINESLVVYNPNPITFNITGVKITYLDYDSFGKPVVVDVSDLGSIYIEPLSQIVVKPEKKGSYCYIQFTYSYKFVEGGVIYESRRIDFTP